VSDDDAVSASHSALQVLNRIFLL